MRLLFSYHTETASNLRKLLNGSEVPETDKAVDLTIHTKAPSKWLLIDLETGQEYIGSEEPNLYGKWKRVKDRSEFRPDELW
jgi:hypothetical protein